MLDRNTVHFERPQINLSRRTYVRMWIASGVSFLAVLQSALSDGFRSLFVALAALCAAVACEAIIGRIKNKFTLRDGSAVCTALILTLVLPNSIHPLIAAFASAFAIVVIKHSGGGLGTNWLNPALGGLMFVRLSWPLLYNTALANSPLTYIANNSADIISGGQTYYANILSTAGFTVSKIDVFITDFLNKIFLKPFGSLLPYGYISLFSSSDAGIIGDRAILCLVIGSIIFAVFQVSRIWPALLYVAVYLFLVYITGDVYRIGSSNGDMLFALNSGGTLITAFLLLGDSSTQTKTYTGMAFSIILCAVLSWYFRFILNESYGALYALLSVNMLTSLLRQLETRYFFENRKTI
jgi:electron transport complex protein RnfD